MDDKNETNKLTSQDQQKSKSDNEMRSVMRGASIMGQIGITVIVCIFIGVFFGRWLDSVLGTEPWMIIIFIFLGIGASFKAMMDIAKKYGGE